MLCLYKPSNEYYSKVLQWLVAMSSNFSSYQTALRLWIYSLQCPLLCLSTHSISAQKALTSPHFCAATQSQHRPITDFITPQYIMLLPTATPEHAFIAAKKRRQLWHVATPACLSECVHHTLPVCPRPLLGPQGRASQTLGHREPTATGTTGEEPKCSLCKLCCCLIFPGVVTQCVLFHQSGSSHCLFMLNHWEAFRCGAGESLCRSAGSLISPQREWGHI